MSKENKKTIAVYQNGGAKRYIETSKIHDDLDGAKAIRKREKLNEFMLKSFSSLPKGASIFEIGSAEGQNAKFLQDKGYNVTASDVADDFIEASRAIGVKTIKFNVLDDKLKEQYDGVFCWRVFVHFTDKDFIKAAKNVYSALRKGGIFVFNMMNRENRAVDSEMVDFNNEYHMGAERFYHYFTQEFVDDTVKKLGFEIQSFHKEGGDQGNKWLVYTLKKS